VRLRQQIGCRTGSEEPREGLTGGPGAHRFGRVRWRHRGRCRAAALEGSDVGIWTRSWVVPGRGGSAEGVADGTALVGTMYDGARRTQI
jgi:hypothetical protein